MVVKKSHLCPIAGVLDVATFADVLGPPASAADSVGM